MTNKEAIEILKNLYLEYSFFNLEESRRHNVAIDMAIEALEAQDVARERYEDLCEYFNNNPHVIELILNDRKEFKAWLERVHWHVLECDKLARKLEALEDKDTDVHGKDTIPMEWIQRYADDWQDMSYAYDNPILGMLEDWRREQDEH